MRIHIQIERYLLTNKKSTVHNIFEDLNEQTCSKYRRGQCTVFAKKRILLMLHIITQPLIKSLETTSEQHLFFYHKIHRYFPPHRRHFHITLHGQMQLKIICSRQCLSHYFYFLL